MKKILMITCALAMAMMLLAGCGTTSSGSSSGTKGNASSTPAASASSEDKTENKKEENRTDAAASSADGSGSEKQTPAETGRIIEPMDNGIDMNALDECTVPVSIEEGGAYLNEDGKLYMKFTVYTYDLFDPVDVASLAVGDTIVICGEKVKVETLEQDAGGNSVINGGLQNDGYALLGDEESNGVRVQLENDAFLYYALGEADIPVNGDDFELDDYAQDPQTPEVFYAGSMLLDSSDHAEYPFSPVNTTLTIQAGEVVGMVRTYAP